jgi:hypothetical protein
MEKVVRKFTSFAEAEAADDLLYASMTPQERMRIVFALRDHRHAKDYPPNGPEPRLERVHRIIKFERS